MRYRDGKRILRWVAILFFGFLVLFTLAPEISITSIAQSKLAKWNHLGIKMEDVRINTRGRIRVRKIALGSPIACTMDELGLRVSLLSLLLGRISLHPIYADSFWIDWHHLASFHQVLKQEMKLDSSYLRKLSDFSFRGGNVRIENLVTSQPIAVGQVFLKIDFGSRPSGKVIARNIKVAGLPALPSVSFQFQARQGALDLDGIRIGWEQAKLKGKMSLDSSANLSGNLELEKTDLGELAENQLSEDQILQGVVWGGATINASLWKKTFAATGTLGGKDIQIRNLSVQNDLVVKKIAPELRDLRFKSLRVENFDFSNMKCRLNSITMEGSPLSVRGGGQVSLYDKAALPDSLKWNGSLSLDLVGNLENDDFQSMNPLFKDGVHLDSAGTPSFRFEIRGTLREQSIGLEDFVPNVVESVSRRIGSGIKKLFK